MAKDYSQKDFVGVYEDLLDIIEASTTTWRPRNSTEADPGVVILKMIAMLEDKYNYRFDMAQAQNYLSSVSDRQSAYELLQMLGYIMKQARAATGTIELTAISSEWDVDSITIPIFTGITDATKTLKFFTTESRTIQNGATSTVIMPVQAGEIFQVTKDGNDTFTLKDVDEQGRLYLGKTNLAQNGVFVLTVDGTDESGNRIETADWTYLDFAILKPQGKWYMVQTSETGEMYIQFPENFEELIDIAELVVKATYTTGVSTNIAVNMLSQFEDSSYRPYLAISQPDAFYTGQDEETISQAIDNYYATKDICNTLVTASDFAAALKYLTVQWVGESIYTNKGDRYFSNIMVSTSQDRKTKVRTTCFDTDYILYEADTTKPTNQIDVIGLSYSSNYLDSFKQVTNTEEIQHIEADIANQLQSQVTVDASIKLDTTNKRILNVAAPEMTIRVANMTDVQILELRKKIQNYFYSTYKADNLVPGEALSEQKIIEDIKALSNNILSISMDELAYTAYTNYSAVDGGSNTIVDTELQKEILARSVLAGDIPLYKYKNRQNTLSKSSILYAMSDIAPEDVVNFIPWSAINYNTCMTNDIPIVTEVTVINDDSIMQHDPASNGQDASDDWYCFKLNNNQIFQIRKPLHHSSIDYGFGMHYAFTRSVTADIEISNPNDTHTVLLTGTKILAGSTLILPAGSALSDSSVINDSSVVIKDFTLTTSITLESGSKINSGSVIADGSMINGEEYHSTICDGVEYKLKAGEVLVITNSSGKTISTLSAGTWILLSGLSISPTNSNDSNILSATQTISVLTDDVITITSDYVYFLSLQNTNTILNCSNGYMLEENEFLIYADKGITEYVTLGPGNIITCTSNLTNNSFASLEDDLSSKFTTVPNDGISAQAYELTSYLASTAIAYRTTTGSNKKFENWESISGDLTTLRIYTDYSDTLQTFNLKANYDDCSVKYADEDTQCRLIMKIETDSSGVVTIEYPCGLILNNEAGSSPTNITTDSERSTLTQLVSSIPFSAVLTDQASSQYLLSSNQKATISATEVNCTQSDIAVPGVSTVEFISDTCVISVNETITDGSETNIASIPISIRDDKDNSLISDLILFNVSFSNIPSGIAALSFSTSAADNNVYIGKVANSAVPLIDKSFDVPKSPSILSTSDLRFGFTMGIYIGADATISDTTKSIALKITVRSGTYVTKLNRLKITLSKLSYVSGYSDELGLSSDSSLAYPNRALASKVVSLDTEYRFNCLATPTEAITNPLNPNNYFNSYHPFNSRTIPLVRINQNLIKFVKER